MREQNTKTQGISSEIHVVSKFIDAGFLVSLPYGDNAPYDLIVDFKGNLLKVQTKTAILRDINTERVHLYSRVGTDRKKRTLYAEQGVDIVAAYSPHTTNIYLIDLKNCSLSEISLRLTKNTKNNQQKKVNYAEDYLFENLIHTYCI